MKAVIRETTWDETDENFEEGHVLYEVYDGSTGVLFETRKEAEEYLAELEK